MGIETRADENQLGLDSVCEFFYPTLDFHEDLTTRGRCREWNVFGESQATTFAGFFFGPGPRIERKTVRRKEGDLGSVQKASCVPLP